MTSPSGWPDARLPQTTWTEAHGSPEAGTGKWSRASCHLDQSFLLVSSSPLAHSEWPGHGARAREPKGSRFSGRPPSPFPVLPEVWPVSDPGHPC